MSFVHLHSHSHYSLLDGVPKIPELVAAAKAAGMPAVALTDHGNLYGAIEFYEEAKAAGIKPIIGLEAYVSPQSIREPGNKQKPFHLILLAKDRTGYENLIQLTTIANLEGFYSKPRIDHEVLRQHSGGLIGLSGCLSGEIPRALRADDQPAARAAAARYLEIFGEGNFYLELQHNPSSPEQALVNRGLAALGAELGIPLVATNDSHYVAPGDNEAQDVLVCIRTKTLLTDENRLSMKHEDYSLAPAEQMQSWFADYPAAVANTLAIADQVNIELDLGQTQIPYYEVPAGQTPESHLRVLCDEGLLRRYEVVTDEIRERVDYELDIISKTGFSSYFLIVQDFINWAKNQGIAVGPGRGSAAGSIVAYLTNITDIDPIHYELLFERFLNPERISMPDIDTDFADIRRNDVLRYVEQKYGKDHVAQIITFGTLGARAALRDVGRVMGFSYGYCDRIAKLIPMFTTLGDAVATVPELKDLLAQDADAERLVSVAQKLEGVARHTSVHACAVVITKDPLNKIVPLQVDSTDGAIISQYSMHPIEALGLLKMDFLGLKNLTIIEDSLNIIRATTGREIKIEAIPLSDKKTFQLLQRAETIGVFQLESSGMRRYLKQLKPSDMEDIIAMVSLYRPGPMEFIPQYIDGKHGRREVTYLEERLRPILQKTYGIAVYQEQIMEIARQLAGYSYGEADVLRKAVGKKIKSLLDEQEQKMVQGMIRNGISGPVAKQIWEFILPFARYGFNRSHAACYAMIAYRTAYLKANFPAQFMAALLNADYGDTDRIAIEVHHAQEMGIEVLPPDINESFGTFTVVKDSLDTEKPRLRFGLKAIKNVGDHIVEVIIAERKANGPFASVEHFLGRINDRDLNKKSLESLIRCGALDSLDERNRLLVNLDLLLQYTRQLQDERLSGQGNLFGGPGQQARPSVTLTDVPPAPDKTKLAWEKELLGLYVTGHPLAELQEQIAQRSPAFATLKELPKRKPVTLIGLVESSKRVTTKNGDAMLFVALADYSAEIEAIIFPSVYKDTLTLWNPESLVEVVGKLDDKDGSLKILVESAKRFQASPPQPAPELRISITVATQVRRSLFDQFREIVRDAAGSPDAIYALELVAEGKTIPINSRVPERIIPQLSELFGQEAVRVIK